MGSVAVAWTIEVAVVRWFVQTVGRRDRAMQELASTQWGVVGRAQLIALGYSEDAIERRVLSRDLVRIHPRTFILAGVPRSWTQSVFAAQIWAGGDSAISHRAAAAVWQLEGIHEPLPELTTPRNLRPTQSVLVHRKRLAPGDVRLHGGLCLTSIPRTLFDLCSVCPPRLVEGALEGALHARLASINQLMEQLQKSGGRGVRGARLFAELINAAAESPLAQSRLERKLARILTRVHPSAPVAQYEVLDGARFVARIDFAYPNKRVAVEADGYRFHGVRNQWERDQQRRTALARLGWRVMHYTWEDVTRQPDRVASEVRDALRLG